MQQIKLQIATLDGAVILFADVSQAKSAARDDGLNSVLALGSRRRTDREAHCIPRPINGRPIATARVAQIAESFLCRFRRRFAVVAGSGAQAAPTAAEWQPGRVRPRT